MSASLSFVGSSQPLWMRPKFVGVPSPRPQSQSLVIEAKATTKREDRTARHTRIRKKVEGTTERPRLSVFRSNKHLYVQMIDDTKMHTLPSASTMQKPISEEFDFTSGPTIGGEATPVWPTGGLMHSLSTQSTLKLPKLNVLERLQEAGLYQFPKLKKGCLLYLFGFGEIHDVRHEVDGFFQACRQRVDD